MLVAETSTSLLWFASIVATANLIRNLDVCRGLVCHAAIAGTVFGAFQFVLFAVTSYFAVGHISSPAKDVESKGDSVGLIKSKWWGSKEALC